MLHHGAAWLPVISLVSYDMRLGVGADWRPGGLMPGGLLRSAWLMSSAAGDAFVCGLMLA